MLLQIGEQKILENILAGMKAKGIPLPLTEEELRLSYQRYLMEMQPHCVWLRADPLIPVEKAVLNPVSISKVISVFQGNSSLLDDRAQTQVIKSESAPSSSNATLIPDAIQKMRLVAPLHHTFLDLFIEHIFFAGAEVASGGSTSNAVGVIWANPHPKFSVDDALEFLVHELTHNLLFLDEWVHPHYDYSVITSPKTWCYSAILKTKRPLDKVVHSLVVAAEIVLLRSLLLGEPKNPAAHPPSQEMIEAICRSLADIYELTEAKSFIYPRIWELLKIIEDKVIQLSSSTPGTIPEEKTATPVLSS